MNEKIWPEDLWTKIQDQQAMLDKLQRKYNAIKGDLRKTKERLNESVEALRQVEKNCPCGARPESLHTHSHVTGCPVGEFLGGTVGDHYAQAIGE